MSNLLVELDKEVNGDKSYCISPETVHEAIRRGVSKADISIAIVDCLAGNTMEYYMEDRTCCAFVALHEEYYQEAKEKEQE